MKTKMRQEKYLLVATRHSFIAVNFNPRIIQ